MEWVYWVQPTIDGLVLAVSISVCGADLVSCCPCVCNLHTMHLIARTLTRLIMHDEGTWMSLRIDWS